MKDTKQYEFKDSTIDDAINTGLEQLGLRKDQVDIKIKSYGGIFSKACVILTPKEIDEDDDYQLEDTDIDMQEADTIENHKQIADISQNTDAMDAGTDFVKQLLDKMGVECEISAEQDDDGINIILSGGEAGSVIGYRGEVLDAIQYYTLIVVNRDSKDFVRVQLDAGDYRKRRKETLANLAIRLARKTARTGRITELEPMNPFERRVIHTTLANDKFVSTTSEGEGRYRHVVIIPKDRDLTSDKSQSDYRYGESNFRKKGPTKTRGFGYSSKKF